MDFCEYCQKEIKNKKPRQKFCSKKCRVNSRSARYNYYSKYGTQITTRLELMQTIKSVKAFKNEII